MSTPDMSGISRFLDREYSGWLEMGAKLLEILNFKMKHMKTQIIFFFTLLFLASCGGKKTVESAPEVNSNPMAIELTDAQFKMINVQIGSIEKRVLSSVIKATGMLDVPPQNLVSISAQMGGFVKSTSLLQGSKVYRGQTIAVIQNADFIQIQQDYLENKSQEEYLKAEYDRQQELAKENVNSTKTVQQAKAQYQVLVAKLAGLSAKLNYIGINPNTVSPSTIRNTVAITSPINGFVTQINVNIGSFVNSSDVLFKIVDTEHLHAELTIFEKDVPKLSVGQKVRFILANETEERIATIHLVGKEIGTDRTVRVHCHLDREDLELIPGTYLKAFVEAGQNNVMAIPDNAVVSFEDKDYIVSVVTQKKGHHYKLIAITKGISGAGYTEIYLPQDCQVDVKVVTNGAYDILSKLMNAEEE
jgi:membrane fusion protein, heavy metal efflux system